MILLLLLACAEPEPPPRPLYDTLLNPEKPPRPPDPPVVRTAADLIANDREWVEMHGVLANVQRTRPPKAHWSVQIELTDGTRLMPAVVGDVSPWVPLEGQPTRVVGLLSLCGTWIAQQIGAGHFLVDHDAPQALGEDLVVTATEAEREAAKQVVEAHCARQRAAVRSQLEPTKTSVPTVR